MQLGETIEELKSWDFQIHINHAGREGRGRTPGSLHLENRMIYSYLGN